MKWNLYIALLLFCICITSNVPAQSDSLSSNTVWRNMSLSGYIKDMNIVAIPKISGIWTIDHLVHNRLNYQWNISKSFTFRVEARNRLFFGESVKNNPVFGDLINHSLDYFTLGDIVVQQQSFMIHSIIDRANLSWTIGKWLIAAGKQRINWSQSYVWNPNDIFNAYSFFDFDYEERRGTDAITIAYEASPLSTVQVASNIHDDWDSTIVAGYYRFNKCNYDIQAVAGKYLTDLYVGMGWSGQIKLVGFRGELSYFQPYQSGEDPTFVGDFSFDYQFPNTLNFRLEGIYNSNPIDAAPDIFLLQQVTAKTLIYNNWSTFLSAGYDITPLITVNVNSIWNIDNESWFINPNINISLTQDTNLLIALQTFGGSTGSLYHGHGSYLYTRLKFNF